MELNQLRYVLEIAATGSITQAAKNLYMGQPNLSKSIKELETEIGIPLFYRTHKGVALTPQSEVFIGNVRNIVAQVDSLKRLYRPDAAQSPSLRVAVPRASYVAYAFGAYIGNFATQPLDVFYHETNAKNIIKEVAQATADMGVVRFCAEHKAYYTQKMQNSALSVQPLWEYDMVLLMHKTHPLAAAKEIPMNELQQFPQIVHEDSEHVSLPTAQTEDESAPKQSRISVFDRASQFALLQSIKGSYLWVTPVPFSVLSMYDLVQKPCSGAAAYCDVLIHRTSQPFTEIQQGFADVLKNDIQSLAQTI